MAIETEKNPLPIANSQLYHARSIAMTKKFCSAQFSPHPYSRLNWALRTNFTAVSAIGHDIMAFLRKMRYPTLHWTLGIGPAVGRRALGYPHFFENRYSNYNSRNTNYNYKQQKNDRKERNCFSQSSC